MCGDGCRWAPGRGEQVDEGGTVGDRDSLLESLPRAQASEDGPFFRSDSYRRAEGWAGIGPEKDRGEMGSILCSSN